MSVSHEIEVTPEMINAGVDTYLNFCPDSGWGDSLDREMVREIFTAMSGVSREDH